MTAGFGDPGGKTRVTMAQNLPIAAAKTNAATEVWARNFDQLDDYLGRT